MLIIRLQRTGRKHESTFRLVLTDSKNGPKSGKFIDILGSYDPRHKKSTVIKADKIKDWLEKGVKLSDTVHNLLIEKKVITGKKINVLPKKTPIKKEGPAVEEKKPAEEQKPVIEEKPEPAQEQQTATE